MTEKITGVYVERKKTVTYSLQDGIWQWDGPSQTWIKTRVYTNTHRER